jgi:malonate decarboxylase beta subunit
VIVSEQGRIGVSGPEVIETNKGVEEYDSRDKALVWSVCGGKNRRLLGMADAFTADSMAGFREAAKAQMTLSAPFNIATLQAEQKRLTERQEKLGACDDANAMWKILGVKTPEAVADMDAAGFISLANGIKDSNHDAR